jgi:hypothetical protein
MKEAVATMRRTRRGKLVLVVLAWGVAYIFASLAIDTARILYYILAIALAIAGIRWLVLAFKR